MIGLATTLSTLTAQQITKEDRKYLYEDELYDCNEIGVILRSNKEASIHYKKYKSMRSASRFFGYSGAALLGGGFLAMSLNCDRCDSPSDVQILGIWSILLSPVFIILSIPTTLTSKIRFNNAIKTFNNADIGYRPRQGPTLHLRTQEHGIGIGVVF